MTTFWIDLENVQLSDSVWLQALPLGSYKHPAYGKLDITVDKIKRLADSVKSKVRGIDLDIDYDHKLDPSKGAKAAGWIKDAAARPDGLWFLVEFTKEASESLRNKEYRYFSAEFMNKWTDHEGKVYNDVVAGGSLTNRPFLKNILPINLSEVVGETEEGMDRKKLIKALKLSDDATDEQIIEAAEEKQLELELDLSKAEATTSDDGKSIVVTHPDATGEFKYEFKEEEEDDESLKKLAEANPAVAQLLAERKKDETRIRNLEIANRQSELNTQLREIEGLPPVALSEIRDAVVGLPKDKADKVIDSVKKFVETGAVPSGQMSKGSNRSHDEDANESDAVRKFSEAVDKLTTGENPLDYVDAVEKVSLEKPELYNEYCRAVTPAMSTGGGEE